MRPLLILLFSLVYSAAFAQLLPDTLHWRADRPLRLDDFRGRAIPSLPGETGSEFHYQVGYAFQSIGLGQRAIETYCLMQRDLSWVAPGVRNATTLRYFKLTFNLAELAARQLKARLIELPSEPALKQAVEQIYYEVSYALANEVKRMKAETQFGHNAEALTRWEQETDSRLARTPRLLTVRRLSKVSYGMFFGLGTTGLTGGLGRHFTAPLAFSYGFDVGYRQWLVLLHATLTGGHVREPLTYRDQQWELGLKTGFFAAEAAVGRVLFESQRHRLTPYVGLAFLGPSVRMPGDDKRLQSLAFTRATVSLGLQNDFFFKRTGDSMEEASFWLRTKFFVTPVSVRHNLGGTLVNLQLGIGGTGRLRRVGYQPMTSVPGGRLL